LSQNSGPSAYELLLSSSQGDIEAFSELFERYSEKLFNFAYYLTYSKEDSEDITSETFISVYQAIQGRDITKFNLQAYLYKTAKSASLKSIERRKREGLTMEETMAFSDPGIFADPERAALLSEQRELVRQTSEELTLDQQSALLLKELEGLPYDTIASVLDSNPNAVGALLSRARLKFREAFRMAHVSEPLTDECTALLPLMSKYIDNEATPEERELISEHLVTCPICNENLNSMQEASVTYRSLIPFLPLATFKVWSMAKAAIAGKAVIAGAAAAGAHAGAGAGAGASSGAAAAGGGAAAAGGAGAAATAAATVGTAAGLGVITKILIVAATVLVLGGAGTGGYIALKATVFARKTVPTLTGMNEKDTDAKAEEAGLKATCTYPDPIRTGNEVGTAQNPKAKTQVDSGTTVKVIMVDKEMAAAIDSATKAISGANDALRGIQGLNPNPPDTTDLSNNMQNAQQLLNEKKSVASLTGPTDSAVYYSNVVVQQCDARKQAWQAERKRQTLEEAAKTVIIESALSGFQTDQGWRPQKYWLERFRMKADASIAEAWFQWYYPPGSDPVLAGQRGQGWAVQVVRNGDTWTVRWSGTSTIPEDGFIVF